MPYPAPLAAALCALLLVTPLAGAIAQARFDVSMRDGRLSVRANGAPATALAAALGEETGVRFSLAGDADQPISAEIVDQPLIEAIALLSPNHLLIRAEGGANAPLIEVVLMLDDGPDGSGGGGETEFLPSGEPADELYAEEGAVPPAGDESELEPGLEPIGAGAVDPATFDENALPPEEQLGPDGQPLVQ